MRREQKFLLVLFLCLDLLQLQKESTPTDLATNASAAAPAIVKTAENNDIVKQLVQTIKDVVEKAKTETKNTAPEVLSLVIRTTLTNTNEQIAALKNLTKENYLQLFEKLSEEKLIAEKNKNNLTNLVNDSSVQATSYYDIVFSTLLNTIASDATISHANAKEVKVMARSPQVVPQDAGTVQQPAPTTKKLTDSERMSVDSNMVLFRKL